MDTRRNWETLPAELLQVILQFAAINQSKADVCNKTLVCKAWKSTAQTVAYSDIAIETISQFKKFYKTIDQSSHLGIKIRTLFFRFRIYTLEETDGVEVSNRLTSLLKTSLPNLETLEMIDLHTRIPTLHTLLNSQLKKFKRLQYPLDYAADNEFENYTKCAFIMKDRLENLHITWGYSFLGNQRGEKITMGLQHLYDNLHQFSNLVDIKASLVASDGIQVLEHIVESCRFLKNIKIKLRASTDQPNRTLPISEYLPRSNIKVLAVSLGRGRNDHNLLWYIMHKFSQLRHLSLDLYEDDPLHDNCLVAHFLEYLSTIDEFSVNGLSTNQSDFMETIGNFWEKTSKFGSKHLRVNYPVEFPENVKAILQITRRSNEEIKSTLDYPSHTDFDWRSFIDFIKRSGKYVGTISFEFNLEDHRLDKTIPGIFFYDTLTNCPNLRNLYFNSCSLNDSLHSATALERRFSINEISFQFCGIHPLILNQLSPLIYKINELRIFATSTFLSGNGLHNEDIPLLLIITMPHTDIKCITFEAERSKQEIYVKVLAISDQTCYYYKFVDTGRDHWVQTSTEHEFVAVNNDKHVYVCCLARPTFETQEFC